MKYLTKFYCLVILGVFLSFDSYAQVKQNISKDFLAYTDLIAKKNFKESAEYMPEEVFKIVPKEKLIEGLEQSMTKTEINFEFKNSEISSINQVKKIKGKYYCTFKYVSNMRMRYNNDTAKNDSVNYPPNLNLVKLALQNTFGVYNVKLDEKTGWFDIAADKKACAISLNGISGWKFMVFDPEQRVLIDGILPKEIIAELN